MTFSQVLQDYLKRINSSASSQNTADALNQWLPEKKRLTRQAVSQWQKFEKADDGFFYALLFHAPQSSQEYKFAYDALVAMGML